MNDRPALLIVVLLSALAALTALVLLWMAAQIAPLQPVSYVVRSSPFATVRPVRTPRPPRSLRGSPVRVTATSAPTPPPAVTRTDSPELVTISHYSMGARTANGERAVDGLTCAAAPRWPLGITITFRNPENGRTVNVRLNDRGNFARLGRSFDCRDAVWHALGIPLGRGVATVEVIG